MPSKKWIVQAESDYRCMHMLLANCKNTKAEYFACQSIAKSQQTVEKSFKAIVAELDRLKKITIANYTQSHYVSKHWKALIIGFTNAKRNTKEWKIAELLGYCDIKAIKELEALVPSQKNLGRNTEYPYKTGAKWHAPADPDAFTLQEAEFYANVATNIYCQCKRILSLIRL